MKTRITLAFTLFISVFAFAQDPIASMTAFNLPESYKLESENDFKNFKNSAKDAMQYMVATNPAENPDYWIKVSEFVDNWLIGTTDVSVSLITDIKSELEGDKFEYAKEYGAIFYASKALYQLDNNGDAASRAGVEFALSKVFENYTALKAANPEIKSKVIEKYLALQEKGKLEETLIKIIGE